MAASPFIAARINDIAHLIIVVFLVAHACFPIVVYVQMSTTHFRFLSAWCRKP